MIFSKPKIVVASGYFNPLGVHHLDYLNNAKNLFNKTHLIVIVNNTFQVNLKKSIPFYSAEDRVHIINNLKCVDDVFLSQSIDETIAYDLQLLYQWKYKIHTFANGGPTNLNLKEKAICDKYSIKMEFNVGGSAKDGASSQVIERSAKEWLKRNSEFRLEP